MNNLLDAMSAACRNVGVFPPGALPDVGKWAEADIEGDKRGKGDARIKLFHDGEGGIVHNWKSGEQQVFFADNAKSLTPEQRAARHQAIEAARIRAEAELQKERKEAASKAAEIWKAATPAGEHPYLRRKDVPPVATLREIDASAAAAILGYSPKSKGEPLSGSLLVAPVKVGAKLSTCELIDEAGRKSAIYGGAKAGGYWAAQSLPNGDGEGLTLLIGEGVATALSAKDASEHPSIAALSADNLLAVAKAKRERYPAATLVVLADLVKATGAPDPRAIEAARSVGGLVAIPDFGTDRPEGATDFNDMAQRRGLEAVKQAIAGASAPAMAEHQPNTGNAPAGDPGEWPEPQPLAARVEPEPYPVDALPDTIRAAVKEVTEFVKCPLPLVASSALSALSLVIQAHADVRRDEILSGPVGLFLLTIADSGERKSQADKMFIKPIQDYQDAQAEEAKPAWKDYKAKLEAWEAKRGGIKDKIRQLAKSNKPTTGEETNLRDLEHEKPEPPRVPKLIREDATPAGLAKKLQQEWPSAGVISNEAGIVFGAHGMKTESQMQQLALLNKMWDGQPYQSDRADDERSRDVRGARLTMGLMIQELTLRAFFDQSKGLARGTGFLARFLVAWPDSTMGTRFYANPVAGSPALSAFNRRIAELLKQPAPIDDNGALTPAILPLTAEAKAAWIAFHDAIEGELASGGELYDVRDVASKSADNAARLAALFQIFEGAGGAIGAEAFERASRIAAWHLNEARRFFGELALPPELVGVARLDAWLIAYCKRERTHLVPIAKLQQGGPGGLRSKATIETAMRELEDSGRAQWVRDGKRKMIAVNPELIEGGTS